MLGFIGGKSTLNVPLVACISRGDISTALMLARAWNFSPAEAEPRPAAKAMAVAVRNDLVRMI